MAHRPSLKSRLLSSLLLTFISLSAPILVELAYSYPCGFPGDDRGECAYVPGFEPGSEFGGPWDWTVPQGYFGTDFDNVFTILTDWDWTDPDVPSGKWGITELQIFADHILNNDPDESREFYNLAHKITDYFGDDYYAGIHGQIGYRTCLHEDYTVPGWGGDGLLEHFYIYLSYWASSGNGIKDGVALPTKYGLENAINFGFVHEFQHVVAHAWGGKTLDSEIRFNGRGSDFSELMSEHAEFRIGGHGSSSQFVSPVYDKSILGAQTYPELCSYYPGNPGDPCINGSHPKHYAQWGLFAAYLENSFGKNDLPFFDATYKWIRLGEPNGTGGIQYDHSLAGLVNILGNDFGHMFTEGPEVILLNELMHKFALAQFVNIPSAAPGTPEMLFQWFNNDGCLCDDPTNCFKEFHCGNADERGPWLP